MPVDDLPEDAATRRQMLIAERRAGGRTRRGEGRPG
jgi:hypothetical protein